MAAPPSPPTAVREPYDLKARTAELERALRQRGTEERAEAEKRYLKSELDHYGVPVPEIRRIVRGMLRNGPPESRRSLLNWVEALYARDVHELRMAAVEILVAMVRYLRPIDIRLIEELVRRSYTWALVDPLATLVAPPLLAKSDNADQTLDRWAKDQDFWLRRAALLAHLRPLREGDEQLPRFLRYADLMLEDPQLFIRKAIGWVLRETGKRRPDAVYDWLEPRIEKVSGVTLREAIKYLPAGQRKQLANRYLQRKSHHAPRRR